MYKKYYQKFLKANPDVQHYASHSHHYWPDVTREAMIQYWDDSAKLVDDKWNYFFSTKIPQAQKLISEIIKINAPEQIVFAPNTHELAYRLLSCLDFKKKIKILTTDSEFYSFERQINRLCESSLLEVEKVPTQPYVDFEERFINKINEQDYDMIFFSHVFFNSGVVVKNFEKLVAAVNNPETLIVVDAYHSFMALPTDLSQLQDRIFYIAGAYKYAQGGEGCCFMSVPKGCRLRPAYTGWFAGFSELATKGGAVSYSNDGLRFAGSTMDFSALYRLHAVLELFKKENITVEKIHDYIRRMQNNFREHLKEINHKVLNEKNIVHLDFNHHGHFFAFETGDPSLTKKLHDELHAKNIRTDYRGTRLRFGFGLYQNECVNLRDV